MELEGEIVIFLCRHHDPVSYVVLFQAPEPYGLSYLEIDILFAKRAKAAKFRVFQRNLERSGYNEIGSGERTASMWQMY